MSAKRHGYWPKDANTIDRTQPIYNCPRPDCDAQSTSPIDSHESHPQPKRQGGSR